MKNIITTNTLLLIGLMAFTQNNSQTKHSKGMENEKLIQTVSSIFTGADEHDWKKIINTMAENVLLDYSSLSGIPAATISKNKIVEAWKGFLPGFDKTHHQLSNFQVTQNGSIATIHFNGKADHFLNKDVWTVEGTYDAEVSKTKTEWLVTKLKFNLSKQSGNTSLPPHAIQKLKSQNKITMKKKIKFNSDGFVLVGNLYTPENFDPAKKYPAIIVDGSWTTVKEQMQGLYASELAKEDFITLAFDHSYYGESEGQPRFWENPKAKIADYKNAITFLQTVQGVDTGNIFLTAVCASAGYMGTVAAEDKRVKGLATIAAWLHDGEAVKLFYGGEEGVQAKIKQAQQAKKKFAQTGAVDYILTVSKTDKTAAMGDFDYYLNANRGAVPQWSADKFAVMGWEDWLTFNPMPIAKNIHVPTLMIHSDGAVLADYAKRFFNDITSENKVLHWTEGTQFDFYDNPKQVGESVKVVSTFFKKNTH